MVSANEENPNQSSGPNEERPPSSSSKRPASQRPNISDLIPRPKKKYPKRAPVWQHFDVTEHDKSKAACKYCGLEVGCDSKTSGTSPMNGHISRCKLYLAFAEREKQKVLASDSGGNMKVVKYDPNLFRRSVNEMVVVNELPFSFVESEGFKRFCGNVIPMYQTFSRRTCCRDISEMFLLDKKKLKNLFMGSKQRVSLTTDIWTAPTTSYNYMVVTAHWIDNNWEMQKRIIWFRVITDHRGETICGHLIDCIEEWGIDKVFCVTVDNAKANDKGLGFFRDFLRGLGGDTMVLDGEYMHMRCCAHILNLIVGDGLKATNTSIVAIRNAIKYVRSNFNRLRSFAMRCETGKVQRGSLPLDVVTRWNSTLLMLSAALKYRMPFGKMLCEDKLYCDYFVEIDEKTKLKRVGPPTASDWDDVQLLVKFLKVFYKCTLTFSASSSVTSNVAYNEIVNLERSLIARCGNSDGRIRRQAHVMRDKFDKYWDGLENMNPLVIVASVFDPRNKMQFVTLCFDQLYGVGSVESMRLCKLVTTVMKRMYEEYSSRLTKSNESQGSGCASFAVQVGSNEVSDDEDVESIEVMYSRVASSSSNNSGSNELDVYLNEKTEMRVDNNLGMGFDVLSWWRKNSTKFPILSEIARDVLAIQVSSVASESVFSTSGRVLDSYRSSLTPYMVEVLLCLQNWLRSSHKSEGQSNNIVHMMEDLEFYDSLDENVTADSSNIDT